MRTNVTPRWVKANPEHPEEPTAMYDDVLPQPTPTAAPGTGQRFLRLVAPIDPVAELTPREREVLGLMAQGRSNQSICDVLFISPKTLERHVQHIFAKLDLPPSPDDHRRVCAVLTWLNSPVGAA